MSEAAFSEGAAWVGHRNDRVPEPICETDIAALIDGKEDVQDDLAACAEIMRAIFDYCFQPREARGRLPELDLSFRRFCCVTWLLRPELLDNISLSELAPHLGVTRAALSKAIRKFGDAHGIRNNLQKREASREVYSAAQKRDHWRYRDKAKPAAPCEATGSDAQHERIPNAIEDSA